jgi:hypothetical protein
MNAARSKTRQPKISDKPQSERLKETAREIGADEQSDAFDRIAGEMSASAAQSKRQLSSALRPTAIYVAQR